jgi:hypothetical protein
MFLTTLLISTVLNINTPDIPTDTGPTNPGIPEEVKPVVRSSQSTDSCEEDNTKPGCTRRDLRLAQ